MLQYFRRRAPDIHVLVLLAFVSYLLFLSVFAVRCRWMSLSCRRISLPASVCTSRIAATCERAPSVRGDTPIFSLAEVADFVARSHPEFSQKLAKLSVRHVRAMKFSVYRRCAGGTTDSLKHLRLGPQGGRRVHFRIAVGLRTAGRLGSVC